MFGFIRNKRRTKRKQSLPVDWQDALDIKNMVYSLIDHLGLDNFDKDGLHFFRSTNSSARAYARIWGLSKVWQKALNVKPAYIIEVISEKFDNLAELEKKKVLMHELAHIPKNFSGSLLPHVRRKGKRNFEDRVHEFVNQYMTNSKRK